MRGCQFHYLLNQYIYIHVDLVNGCILYIYIQCMYTGYMQIQRKINITYSHIHQRVPRYNQSLSELSHISTPIIQSRSIYSYNTVWNPVLSLLLQYSLEPCTLSTPTIQSGTMYFPSLQYSLEPALSTPTIQSGTLYSLYSYNTVWNPVLPLLLQYSLEPYTLYFSNTVWNQAFVTISLSITSSYLF